MAKGTVTLAHGADTYALVQLRQTWQLRFQDKYPDGAVETVSALDADWLQKVAELLESLSLLTPAVAVVLDDAEALLTKAVEDLAVRTAKLGDDAHLLILARRELDDRSPLRTKRGTNWQEKAFRAPTVRTLVERVPNLGVSAAKRLDQHLRDLEQQERQELRLRTGQNLPVDHRPWLVAGLAQQLAGLESVSSNQLEPFLGETTTESLFPLVRAVAANNWKEAHRIHKSWGSEEVGPYFGLVALLWRDVTNPSARALIAEFELHLRNLSVPACDLFTLLLFKAEAGKSRLIDRSVLLQLTASRT